MQFLFRMLPLLEIIVSNLRGKRGEGRSDFFHISHNALKFPFLWERDWSKCQCIGASLIEGILFYDLDMSCAKLLDEDPFFYVHWLGSVHMDGGVLQGDLHLGDCYEKLIFLDDNRLLNNYVVYPFCWP